MTGFSRTIVGLVTAAGLAAASSAAAQGFLGHGQWYVKGFGGATFPQDESGDVRDGGTFIADGDASYDTGYTLGAAVGAYFTPSLAMEIEYAYRNADNETDIDGVVDNLNGDIDVNAVMFNVLYNFQGVGGMAAWKPYVGGGLGWATYESHIGTIGDFSRDNAFAYQVMAGVGYEFAPQWSAYGEVRWFGTDGDELDGPGSLTWDASFETIDLLVGVEYQF